MLANTVVHRLDSGDVQAIRVTDRAWPMREGKRRGGARPPAESAGLRRRGVRDRVSLLRLQARTPEEWRRAKEESEERGDRRARATMMRLVRANGFTRMVTLTVNPAKIEQTRLDLGTAAHAGSPQPSAGARSLHVEATSEARNHGGVACHDASGVGASCGALTPGVHDRPTALAMYGRFRREAQRAGVKVLGVLRKHPGGHGYHVHVLVDRYIRKEQLEEWWPHGFVDIRRLPMHQAARYLSKYMSDDHEGDERMPGEHRYYRSQGLKGWTSEDRWCANQEEFIALCAEILATTGGLIESLWESPDGRIHVAWLVPPPDG